jgi:hypothetical protein
VVVENPGYSPAELKRLWLNVAPPVTNRRTPYYYSSHTPSKLLLFVAHPL